LAWQPVSEPALRDRDYFYILLFEADFLVELAKQRFLGLFSFANAPLRKLPAPPAGPPSQKHLMPVANQYDSDIGAKSFGVDEVIHARGRGSGAT
jgi:hypothetical protein